MFELATYQTSQGTKTGVVISKNNKTILVKQIDFGNRSLISGYRLFFFRREVKKKHLIKDRVKFWDGTKTIPIN